ncbi:endonuclease/exonuclease/phosphatase family protein [Pontibacter sp. G13]|uniref:endonuclease/exonuclease/phosphatase family protein n=1 Tax=Pontibacter sp. G13 TaxID=3074898 RepID=UPI00288C5BF9|nr:endonuclease/exonuclease/phosphatase family protein [Pontibacter sp. G13]WNJ16739.1 endonuclease/exonuclease/phosphatase family protein [Pontibacter sp. G13]
MPWYNDLRPTTDEKKVQFGLIFPELLHQPAEKARIIQSLLRLRKGLQTEMPPKKSDGNLILGTWNIREFGKYTHRTPESLYYIAEIINQFDLIGLQEVKGNLADFHKILRLLGSDWDFVINDVTGGNAGNDERFAYLYDKRKVEFTGFSGEIVLWEDGRGAGFPLEQLKRTPLITGFKAGWKKFAIVNLHLHPGDDDDDIELRQKEVKALLKVLTDRVKKNKIWTNNLVILGDLNMYDEDDDSTIELFNKAGFMESKALKGLPTSIGRNPFDRIFYYKRPNFDLNTESSGLSSGVLHFGAYVYQDAAYETYKPQMLAHKGNPETLVTEDDYRDYFRKWVTYQMSDHFPVWLEIDIDSSDEFLEGKLKQLEESIPQT